MADHVTIFLINHSLLWRKTKALSPPPLCRLVVAEHSICIHCRLYYCSRLDKKYSIKQRNYSQPSWESRIDGYLLLYRCYHCHDYENMVKSPPKKTFPSTVVDTGTCRCWESGRACTIEHLLGAIPFPSPLLLLLIVENVVVVAFFFFFGWLFDFPHSLIILHHTNTCHR